jgi:ribosome-associated toxin RatA of RatAB toxin-antitoxin module
MFLGLCVFWRLFGMPRARYQRHLRWIITISGILKYWRTRCLLLIRHVISLTDSKCKNCSFETLRGRHQFVKTSKKIVIVNGILLQKFSSEILFIYLSLFYGRVFSALIYFNKNNACLHWGVDINLLKLVRKLWPTFRMLVMFVSHVFLNEIYNYLCNRCLSPLKLWARIPLMVWCTQ